MEYLLFCAGSLNLMQSGLNLGWPSYALPQLLRNDSAVPLTNNEGSWVASTFLLGTMSGSVLLALTVDVFGRRTMLCVTSLPVCASWLMIAYAKSPWYFYLARYIAGISDGAAFSCLPLYIAEVCNSNIRGFLISGTIVSAFLGIFIANLLGAFLSITKVALICAILAVVPFCLYLSIPESPQFYVIRRKFDKAKISLKKFNEKGDVDAVLNSLKITWIEQQANKKIWWQLFFDKNNCKYLGVIIALVVFQHSSGIMGITAYIETIFKKVNIEVDPIVFITVFYLLQIAVATLNSILIDKVGRRPLFLISTSLVSCGLFCVTIYFVLENAGQAHMSKYSWLAILGLFVYIVGYTTGLENIPIVLCSEIFSMNFKAPACGIKNIMFGLIGAAVPKFFQYTKDKVGTHHIVYFASVVDKHHLHVAARKRRTTQTCKREEKEEEEEKTSRNKIKEISAVKQSTCDDENFTYDLSRIDQISLL
ncbi:hypothetical protein FQR65_LT01938 [Abscondita terminalis]|nr:hypothetical protein FQR65_LT01938 [Abscondita terminalis]